MKHPAHPFNHVFLEVTVEKTTRVQATSLQTTLLYTYKPPMTPLCIFYMMETEVKILSLTRLFKHFEGCYKLKFYFKIAMRQ